MEIFKNCILFFAALYVTFYASALIALFVGFASFPHEVLYVIIASVSLLTFSVELIASVFLIASLIVKKRNFTAMWINYRIGCCACMCCITLLIAIPILVLVGINVNSAAASGNNSHTTQPPDYTTNRYPQEVGNPYPQGGGNPYPQGGGNPYPQGGGYPYPQGGGYPYPQGGGYPYPQRGGNRYSYGVHNYYNPGFKNRHPQRSADNDFQETSQRGIDLKALTTAILVFIIGDRLLSGPLGLCFAFTVRKYQRDAQQEEQKNRSQMEGEDVKVPTYGNPYENQWEQRWVTPNTVYPWEPEDASYYETVYPGGNAYCQESYCPALGNYYPNQT